jgi:hypothetical protein
VLARRLQHAQASEGGANPVPDCDVRRLAESQCGEESLHLGFVALFREPARTLADNAGADYGLSEVFRGGSDSSNECFDVLAT